MANSSMVGWSGGSYTVDSSISGSSMVDRAEASKDWSSDEYIGGLNSSDSKMSADVSPSRLLS